MRFVILSACWSVENSRVVVRLKRCPSWLERLFGVAPAITDLYFRPHNEKHVIEDVRRAYVNSNTDLFYVVTEREVEPWVLNHFCKAWSLYHREQEWQPVQPARLPAARLLR